MDDADDESGRRGSCSESRLQRLRWVAQTIAEYGGHKYTGATESCPLLHALNTTKKQLDSLDADMAALDSELERARLCLQVRCSDHMLAGCRVACPVIGSVQGRAALGARSSSCHP